MFGRKEKLEDVIERREKWEDGEWIMCLVGGRDNLVDEKNHLKKFLYNWRDYL